MTFLYFATQRNSLCTSKVNKLAYFFPFSYKKLYVKDLTVQSHDVWWRANLWTWLDSFSFFFLISCLYFPPLFLILSLCLVLLILKGNSVILVWRYIWRNPQICQNLTKSHCHPPKSYKKPKLLLKQHHNSK